MKRIGRYHGSVQRSDFLRLANLFQYSSYQKWQSAYNKYGGRGVGSKKFEIARDGQHKTVVVYDDSGPQAARHASRIFYGLLWKIRWRKVSASDAIAK